MTIKYSDFDYINIHPKFKDKKISKLIESIWEHV